MVLHALSQLVSEFPELKYIVIGTGPDFNRLQRIVRNLCLNHHTIFVGKVHDKELSKYYALSDIFVMASRSHFDYSGRIEGFGLVFAEANAFGKPVIAGKTGGVPEVVIHGYNGILVDPYDVGEIQKAIRKMLLNPEIRRIMGENGRRLVLEKFNILRMAKKVIKIIANT